MTMPRLAADQIADAHEERGHRGKQHGGAEITHELTPGARGTLARAHGKYVGSAGPHHKYLAGLGAAAALSPERRAALAPRLP